MDESSRCRTILHRHARHRSESSIDRLPREKERPECLLCHVEVNGPEREHERDVADRADIGPVSDAIDALGHGNAEDDLGAIEDGRVVEDDLRDTDAARGGVMYYYWF